MANISIKSAFVTGANRGIGLEIIKQLLGCAHVPQHIFATCRNLNSAKELNDLASQHPNLHLHELEVIDHSKYEEMVKWVEGFVGDNGLTVLINNAGVKAKIAEDGLASITRKTMMDAFEVNTIAPLMLSQSFLPLLKRAASKSSITGLSVSKAAILNVSTMMASISDNGSGGVYSYRASKAALNMVGKSLAVDLKSDGILVASLHPGWVLTDMGGANALIDSQTSVKGMFNVVEGLSENETGNFYNYKGQLLGW